MHRLYHYILSSSLFLLNIFPRIYCCFVVMKWIWGGGGGVVVVIKILSSMNCANLLTMHFVQAKIKFHSS